ncbi:hypothetical protein [Actinoplanes sp. N902-109]|uniref:hypothetical protein n=1 Tax=Actinoplanes sp. (strain N902-109) TaxID=649831 RepID=UPI0005A0F484|nr:hypothetical protein [Actinoplanes sp. N902-109]
MPDDTREQAAPRPVWRRAAAAPRVAGSDVPLTCGGGELSVAEHFELMRERKRALDEERARAHEEEEARRASRRSAAAKPDVEDEDEDKAAERFRNDRYAVKLLQQDDGAWGGGGAGPGVLG